MCDMILMSSISPSVSDVQLKIKHLREDGPGINFLKLRYKMGRGHVHKTDEFLNSLFCHL